jgi:hypothetical protein
MTYFVFMNYPSRYCVWNNLLLKFNCVNALLCKRKEDALVEMTLPKDANIYTSQYQLYLPSKEELQQKLRDWLEGAGAHGQLRLKR